METDSNTCSGRSDKASTCEAVAEEQSDEVELIQSGLTINRHATDKKGGGGRLKRCLNNIAKDAALLDECIMEKDKLGYYDDLLQEGAKKGDRGKEDGGNLFQEGNEGEHEVKEGAKDEKEEDEEEEGEEEEQEEGAEDGEEEKRKVGAGYGKSVGPKLRECRQLRRSVYDEVQECKEFLERLRAHEDTMNDVTADLQLESVKSWLKKRTMLREKYQIL